MSDKQKAVVVIPTYNEAETIGEMIDHLIKKTFPKIDNWQMELLIVDDTSPDGTYKIVQDKQKKYDNLHLLLNPDKVGIGGAYVKGFKHAMNKLSADVIIEFDGDFQHPPQSIPKLLKKIEQGADYVLGSRKIKGGSTPKGWGFKRRFFSSIGGLIARSILFLPSKIFFKITDPTTGLKASRVKGFVDKMDMDNLYSQNFGYKLEFLYKMVKLGAKVEEIPLKFNLRKAGESKITPKTSKDIFRTVILLRLKDPQTQKFLKFATVGFIGFAINAVALEFFRGRAFIKNLAGDFSHLEGTRGLKLLANPNSWSGAFAAELSIISNFLLNNFWTFSSQKILHPFRLILKFLQFNLTSLGAVVIQFVVIGLATLLFGDTTLVRQASLVFSIGFLIIPYNWLMYNLVIWKKDE